MSYKDPRLNKKGARIFLLTHGFLWRSERNPDMIVVIEALPNTSMAEGQVILDITYKFYTSGYKCFMLWFSNLNEGLNLIFYITIGVSDESINLRIK